MSNDHPDLQISSEQASALRIALVTACYNQSLTDALTDAVRKELLAAGVSESNIELRRVPGSAEVPYTVNMLALNGGFDALIGMGVVLAGATDHHRVIAEATASAFQQIALQTETPVINGILTTETLEEAQDRITGPANRGREFARAALYMACEKQDLHRALESASSGEDGHG